MIEHVKAVQKAWRKIYPSIESLIGGKKRASKRKTSKKKRSSGVEVRVIDLVGVLPSKKY
jgi:hypothetical protein